MRSRVLSIALLAGIKIPNTVQSSSLAPVIYGRTSSIYPFVVGYFTDTQRAIREGKWKLILYPQVKRMQLFDIAKDPDELTDLSASVEHADRVADLHVKLLGWLR